MWEMPTVKPGTDKPFKMIPSWQEEATSLRMARNAENGKSDYFKKPSSGIYKHMNAFLPYFDDRYQET